MEKTENKIEVLKKVPMVEVDFSKSSWRHTIEYLVGIMLVPAMVLLSKILKRKITFGACDSDDRKM